ncbi:MULTISPECIES: DUF885 family protein [unclassified Leeuwenhoekiella]|uniref:DUF885 domain-containing protein n=1 Tax=unclassified Leeuwenhoekiella TaxID=2615029 RepID=UPI000C6BE374|nr:MULTISPECIES: DUF885 domain-containing protein [unclassified Leeuwenhoekiella]MAW94536.1 DUF885 domain-containing protein [Leeuwenhoekiella sp.]MBA81959.1 DUF885 domain-containing protein [Leeuwenhoekiella sp.]|tara:strand:- start:1563 stop:3389 length:1827 start_codon:yes stop_codon:yes gene_type:complete
MKYCFSYILLSLVLICSSCKNNQTDDVSPEAIAQNSKALNNWFDAQFNEDVAQSPQWQTELGMKTNYGQWDDISSKQTSEELDRAKERLKHLENEVDPETLDSVTAVSYILYKRNMEQIVEEYEYRFYNYPVNQMYGLHAEVPAFLINKHRIDSVADAEAYISRIKNVKPLFTELRNQLGIRESNLIVPPRFVLDHVLEASTNLLKGRPFEKSSDQMPLLADFESKINKLDIAAAEKDLLMQEATAALVDSLQPAYTELIAFVENQKQRATTDDGAWKFPRGDKFYQIALNKATTTNMTAEEIHELGLNEVARIHGEMKAIMEQTGFEGTLQEFFEFMRTDDRFYYEDSDAGREAYLNKAKAIIDQMRGRLDELFITKPKAEIVVKQVEPFREKSAGKAFYNSPAPDGSRPGIYYANLYDIKAMPKYQMQALAYHEGIPGHHMQLAIAQELNGLPKFRKFGGYYTAYIEGWGLYCEYVPKEMGMYDDPYSDFGRLAMELWRACRLVVDTGIHDKKWTREEGIAYYKENTPNAESDCIKMVERHIVMPGQATAYKVGMNKILELRIKAENELGENFDVRKFHEVILGQGALPLDVLENRVNNYIAASKE